jgi:phosphatidylglycerophosphate synthase
MRPPIGDQPIDRSVSSVGFHIISEDSGPRWLGLRVAERNRRLADRASGGEVRKHTATTLTVPPGVVLTPAFFTRLPSPGGVWELAWKSGRAPIVWRAADASAGQPPRVATLPDDAVLDVSTGSSSRRAAWRMLRASGKPTDGWLSRRLHRPISRVFSCVFLALGLTPNIATFLTLGVGLVAAWLMAQTSQTSMIAGGLLFWFCSIADGIDGEMARLTLSESAAGEALDTAVDQLTHAAGLAGIFVGWWRQGISPAGGLLALVVALGTPAMLLWAMAMVRRARSSDLFFVATKPIEGAVTSAAARTGAAPLRAAAVVFVLFRREAFSLTFFLVSLVTGMRVVYPVLIAVGLAIVAATLVAYRSPIVSSLDAAEGGRLVGRSATAELSGV